MNLINKINIQTKLSTLWIVVIVNMIYADIYSIMVELDKWQRPELFADAKILMLAAVFVTNIPIMMIFLSKFLHYRVNRWLNVCAGVFTILYIWGGMSAYPHYIAAASIETILLLIIVAIAWRWKEKEN